MGCGPSKAPDAVPVEVDGTVLSAGSLKRSKNDSAEAPTLSPFDKSEDSFGSTNGLKEGGLQQSSASGSQSDEVRVAGSVDRLASPRVICVQGGLHERHGIAHRHLAHRHH